MLKRHNNIIDEWAVGDWKKFLTAHLENNLKKMKKSVDFLVEKWYYIIVGSIRNRMNICSRGGIGIRARLRI